MDRDLTVLIVEDDINDVSLLKRALKLNEINNPTQIVTDGMMAVAYLQGEGVYADRVKYPFPSIIISDLKMPRRSGFEVLEWLRANPRCWVIPVIILTASREEQDILKAYKLGANAYLTKPASTGDLVAMFKSVYEFWSWCERPDLPENC